MLDSKSEIISFEDDVNIVSFLVKQELTMLTKVIAWEDYLMKKEYLSC